MVNRAPVLKKAFLLGVVFVTDPLLENKQLTFLLKTAQGNPLIITLQAVLYSAPLGPVTKEWIPTHGWVCSPVE